MVLESAAPPILFKSNKHPINVYRFLCSDFSGQLKISKRDLIDDGIPTKLTTAACAVNFSLQ
jgi:hypothetical protein